MHALDCFADLLKVSPYFALWKSHLRLDGVEQVSSRGVVLHHNIRCLCLVRRIVGGDDVGMFREMFAVLQLPFEVGALGAHFADGLDGDSLAVCPVVGDPGCAIRALAGLLDEGEALVQACLVSGRFDCHCSCLGQVCAFKLTSKIKSDIELPQRYRHLLKIVSVCCICRRRCSFYRRNCRGATPTPFCRLSGGGMPCLRSNIVTLLC